jgi:hypothetical protein
MTKTNALRHIMSVSRGDQVTNIKITLDDDCKNGHEDFSITADIREKDSRGRWVDAGGGCCHEHILSLLPELQPFVDLHLSPWEGVPMYAVENGFYWLAGYLALPWVQHHGSSGSNAKIREECLRIFQEHLRATDDEMPTLLACRSKEELHVAIEDLGMPQRWKQEAAAAIRQLEEWTGETFESRATRGHWTPPSEEDRKLVAERRATGYYTTEAIAARDAQRLADDKAKKRDNLIKECDSYIAKKKRQLDVNLFVLDQFGDINCIYYDHSNTLGVNWTSTEKLVSWEQFEEMQAAFAANPAMSHVTLKWQAFAKH